MNRKRLWWVGLWVSLLGAGLWQGPALARAWQTNRMALAAMEVCGGTRDLSTVAEAAPFLQAGAARCLGNETVAQAQYLEAVSSTDRVEVLHAARPADVELARQVVLRYPGQPKAYYGLGEALLGGVYVWQVPPHLLAESENLTEMIGLYERGLTLDSKNGEEWDNLGRLYEAAGFLDKAVQAFDQACYYVDQGSNGCLNAGRLYLQDEQYALALARYQDSLQQLPGYPASRKGIAKALLGLGRISEAIPYLESLADEGDTEAQTLLAQIREVP